MNNFDSIDKAALNALVEAGARVFSVCYDPTTVIGTPEADALAAGLIPYYREDTARLVEIIYLTVGGVAPPSLTNELEFDKVDNSMYLALISIGVN